MCAAACQLLMTEPALVDHTSSNQRRRKVTVNHDKKR